MIDTQLCDYFLYGFPRHRPHSFRFHIFGELGLRQHYHRRVGYAVTPHGSFGQSSKSFGDQNYRWQALFQQANAVVDTPRGARPSIG